MIARRFLLFVAAAFVPQFQVYAQLRMMLIILSLVQIQLEGKGEDEIGVDIYTLGFSLNPPFHGSIFIAMNPRRIF